MNKNIYTYIFELKNNPRYWSNNKRKFHGYCLLRNKLNRKAYFLEPVKLKIFNTICGIIEEELPLTIQKTIDKFVDIKEYNPIDC